MVRVRSNACELIVGQLLLWVQGSEGSWKQFPISQSQRINRNDPGKVCGAVSWTDETKQCEDLDARNPCASMDHE